MPFWLYKLKNTKVVIDLFYLCIAFLPFNWRFEVYDDETTLYREMGLIIGPICFGIRILLHN